MCKRRRSHASSGYLQRVRQLCDHHQVVLIFDEIITGFRMGLGGAQEMFGVTPDLTTLGKAIAGGGVPVSALVGRADIMKLLVDKKVIHAGTFNGYPLGTAAVKATLEMLGRNGGEAMNRMNLHAEMIHDILTREAAKVGLPLLFKAQRDALPIIVAPKNLAVLPIIHLN